MAAASVIVRTYNSAATLERALRSVRDQDIDVELVIVDSGSTDETLSLARAGADVVVEMPSAEFSYGRALNLGAAASSSDVLAALSSHCELPATTWISTAVAHICEGATAVVGLPEDADGRALDSPIRADSDYLLAHRFWGMSNHASAWSKVAWEREQFDETLGASEDKEWSWRVIGAGDYLVADPRLVVDGAHRRSGGSLAYYRRIVKELTAVAGVRVLPPYQARDALLDWVRRVPRDVALGRTRPMGRTRLIEVAARWRVSRPASRPGEK